MKREIWKQTKIYLHLYLSFCEFFNPVLVQVLTKIFYFLHNCVLPFAIHQYTTCIAVLFIAQPGLNEQVLLLLSEEAQIADVDHVTSLSW